jgi:hypothetical protein
MKKVFLILSAFSVFIVLPAFSQNDSIDSRYAVVDTLQENFGLFDSDELLEISLRFDITYYKKKKSDKDYLDAILTYRTSDKDSINKSLKVRSRGVFRRTYCNFPPLMLNFKIKDTILGEFSNINKLKMVTYCKPGNEEYLLKEYLVYKLYNVLTDNSFRVRLLRVNYINTSKQSKPVRAFAFVIEPTEVLAKRLNSVEVTSTNLTQRDINPEIVDRMAIFNYMIGNTDFTVSTHHNILILAKGSADSPSLRMLVPYDFDFSGLVNTNYSTPIDNLGLKSVRDRYYLGICRNEEVMLNSIKEFSDRKEEFYRVIKEFPYLSAKSKNEMNRYLDGFFIGFDKRNSVLYGLLKNCPPD